MIISKNIIFEIKKRTEEDQNLRKKIYTQNNQKLWDKIVSCDKNNTLFMKNFLSEINLWPDSSLIGEDGEHNAWLLIQHADLDADFQEKCLKLMKENNKSNLHYIAYLTDRVMVNRSKEERSDYHCGDNQVYYTQWRYLNENDETAFYIPNIDWVKVFKKRQSIHLPHAFPGDVFSQLLSQHPKLKQFLEKENQL